MQVQGQKGPSKQNLLAASLCPLKNTRLLHDQNHDKTQNQDSSIHVGTLIGESHQHILNIKAFRRFSSTVCLSGVD